MSFLINPFAFLAAGGDFESIATVTVGSGGASSIEFTSIPGTYQHLQVRMMALAASTAYLDVRLNGDTASNYARHYLIGNATAAAAGATASTNMMIPLGYHVGMTSSSPSGVVLDLLDYTSTTKTKVVRGLAGTDTNSSGEIVVSSGLWNSTSAVTSILLRGQNGTVNFAQHTTAALYGLRAP